MLAPTYVLGVSMSNHDRAACLLKNGLIVGAISEERIDRRKRSEGFYNADDRAIVIPPLGAIRYLLESEGIGLNDLGLVVCGRSIVSAREHLLTYLPIAEDRLVEPPPPGHHLAHAYSAYATSPFQEAAVLVVDEQGHHGQDGSFEKCSWFVGSNGPLVRLRQFFGSRTDLSLGMFYDAFAAVIGLEEAGRPSAGKLMGLAAFGKNRSDWPRLVSLDVPTGDARVSLEQLDEFFSLAGLSRRGWFGDGWVDSLDDLQMKYRPVSWASPVAADLARKAQDELEDGIRHVARAFRNSCDSTNLCYSGGVALNCPANSRLCEAGWNDVYVHSAATDDGAAVGLAFYGWIEVLGFPRSILPRFHPHTGRHYRKDEVRQAIGRFRLDGLETTVSPSSEGAARLARGEIVCWFQGRSEWGPRALGARSILANPLIPGVKDRLNGVVKYRESFRPFGVSLTQESVSRLIDLNHVPSSLGWYMLAVAKAIDSRLAEVTHADGTVRYQVVSSTPQSEWHELLRMFGRATGLEAVINTSFNTLGEPLVESPQDAIRQFLLARPDALIIEDLVIDRKTIPSDVLQRTIDLAWERTPVDPLHCALKLEAAGYPDAAVSLLEDRRYSPEQARAAGFDGLLKYQGLYLRRAIRMAETEEAVARAEAILQLAAMPAEVKEAAAWLAKHADSLIGSKLGQLMDTIAPPGGAFALFRELLVPHPPEE